METDLAAWDRFLREQGRERRSTEIEERLRPFAAMADAGTYRLSGEAVDPAELAGALALATGRPVERVASLASRELVATMTRGQRADHLARTGVTIKDGLWIRLLYEHAVALEVALGGPDAKQRLYDAFASALGLRLRRAFEDRFLPVIGDIRWLNTTAALGDLLLLGAWNGVEETLFYWLAFTLADDARAERLSPLVGMLAAAVPLCESGRERGLWLALTE